MREPIAPQELSGLIDGELEVSRAQEVRQAVEADDTLTAELAELERADSVLSQAASRAAFAPKISLPATGRRAARTAAIAAGLLFVAGAWVLPKVLVAPLAAMGVQALALALVIAALLNAAGKAEADGIAPR